MNKNNLISRQDPQPPPLVINGEFSEPDAESNLKAHKAAFFFKLERELEKINAFYLQKEADLKVRLRTLIDKRKIVQLSRTRKMTKTNSSFTTLYEGFRNFEKDLRKLQTFVEINQTGFRKILKKWDKRSKSTTKELYLARQVEVQPVFNRECIAELNDVAAANVLELEELLIDSDDHDSRHWSSNPSADGIPSDRIIPLISNHETDVEMDVIEFEEFETSLTKAVQDNNRDQVQELLRNLHVPSSPVDQSAPIRNRISRILWKAALHEEDSPSDATCSTGKANRMSILTPSSAMMDQELIPSSRLDFSFVDDISGRSCLHEAASVGRTRLIRQAVDHKVSVLNIDVYGRQPLHYAAMNGHAAACSLLLSCGANAYSSDHDGYTPLIYAVTKGHTECVRTLLNSGVTVDPKQHADFVPLSLACQYGHQEIAVMMLKRGAQILANHEGMWPQHLAAREGHADLLHLLVDSGANVNELDKFNQWTPLFHAASEGHSVCVKVLIEAQSNCQMLDESRKPPIHYAAWRGHIDCVNLLLAEGCVGPKSICAKPDVDISPWSINRTTAPQDGYKSGSSFLTGASSDLQGNDLDVDLIPDLSLPPPIMPFRIYGHNYLDKKALIQLSLGHPNTSRSLRPVVQLYGQPELTSLKLVISNRADPSSAVHSTILPLDYEHESFAFHTDALDQFALEFDLFPTFGTRIMGKAAALPSTFRDSWNHKSYVLPLLDKHLKVIGEVAFELNVISPFQGVQLSLGGRVETYWKATSNVSGVGTGASGVNTASMESPITSPAGTPSTPHPTTAFVTSSSLSGEYVRVVVQVTRDGVPVVYPKATLSLGGLDVQICALTSEQFNTLAIQLKRTLDDIVPDVQEDFTAAKWHTLISQSMTCLKEVLIRMPARFGLNLEIESGKIGNRGSVIGATIGDCHGLDLDTLVDAVLKTIYEAAETNDRTGSTKLRRRLVLSSLDPSVCTALNWKQPNYAVFFASFCGVAGLSSDGQSLLATNREIDDRRCSSMIEATRFAKANNLLGVMFDATLLLRVPSVVQGTKELGLLLTTFGHESVMGADGHLSDEGVLKYTMNDGFESVG